jgi:hypothetical protein
MVQIEETKGKGDDSVVFTKIKPGINGVILNCNNGCPVGPQIANWGFKIINFKAIQNFKCACGGTLDYSKIQQLVFYNSIVDIVYELDDKFLNPYQEVLHLDANIILGNVPE